MREKIDFNDGWIFRLGDQVLAPPFFKDIVYYSAKTERCLRGYASRRYGNNLEIEFDSWRKVTLPHDFIIEQQPKEENTSTTGYFEYHNGWYRKKFKIEECDSGKRISLYFEGVATHATVYFNGSLMAHNFCGYTAFEVDITDYIRYGEYNTVAVYANTTEQHEGWWYSGGGIYRPVWLIKTELVSVDLWGAYVHPEKRESDWYIPVDITIRNDDNVERKLKVKTDIYDNGDIVAQTGSKDITVLAKGKAEISLTATIQNPKLWCCESPNLYKAVVRVFENGNELDAYEVKFGFRTIYYDAKYGFFLNGKHTKIKGVCCHEDYGLQGKAVSNSVKRLRLELLQQMGANAYRTAHYPHSEYTFDCLAELGFLVMAETRWFESSKESLEQLGMMIKCHRNNPAVIIWSLGNEERYFHMPMGRKIFQTMYGYAKSLDDTRPFTLAVDGSASTAPVMEDVDVMGVNYNLAHFEPLHEKFPNKPIFSSECCAVPSTRAWTMDDSSKRGYFHAYDNRGARPGVEYAAARESTWRFISEREWIAGGFQWAGIEHRGECDWPRLCSQSGALDLFLQKKDAFYINQALWSEKPMAHIYPHWNLFGREGETVSVWVYTNCDEIELLQDGKSLGIVAVGGYTHAEFNVVYTHGRLEAIGYKNGQKACTDIVRTTGEPVALELELQNKHGICKDDAVVVNCYALDAQGNRIPDAGVYVCFDTNANGQIIGTGSDICDHMSVTAQDRKMYGGVVSACVSATGEGILRIYARSQGLEAASLTVNVDN